MRQMRYASSSSSAHWYGKRVLKMEKEVESGEDGANLGVLYILAGERASERGEYEKCKKEKKGCNWDLVYRLSNPIAIEFVDGSVDIFWFRFVCRRLCFRGAEMGWKG